MTEKLFENDSYLCRFTARVEEGILEVTLNAECREEITVEQPGRALSEFQGA